MNPIIGGALIGGVGQLLGNWMGSHQQNRNINKTNQANINLANLRYKYDSQMADKAFGHDQRLAEYAFDKNMEMWKMQNQYNSPEQQMARFEEAGLNKHMIYGQGSPGNATSMPTMEAAKYSPPSYQAPSLDYRGTQDPTANVLGSVIGASKAMVELSTAKENLEQQAVNTWLAENTKFARLGQTEQLYQKSFWEAENSRLMSKINAIKKSFWDKGISPSDSTWLRVAIKVANTFPVGENLKKMLNSLDPKLLKAIQ